MKEQNNILPDFTFNNEFYFKEPTEYCSVDPILAEEALTKMIAAVKGVAGIDVCEMLGGSYDIQINNKISINVSFKNSKPRIWIIHKPNGLGDFSTNSKKYTSPPTSAFETHLRVLQASKMTTRELFGNLSPAQAAFLSQYIGYINECYSEE
jgi:hypothetical protein